jgi:cytochrome P450
MSWLWALLSAHPEAEAKLHAELDAVLGRGDAARAPTMDDLPRLPYTDAIVKETLRLYPAIFTFMRTCVAATSLGDYAIPVGMDVSIVPYVTHRDPRFFPEPDAFRPERFLPAPGTTTAPEIDRYAYIPFGGGARICVGNVFAMVEMTMMLATIASRFSLRLVDATPHGVHPVEPVPGVTLRAKPPLRAKLVRR